MRVLGNSKEKVLTDQLSARLDEGPGALDSSLFDAPGNTSIPQEAYEGQGIIAGKDTSEGFSEQNSYSEEKQISTSPVGTVKKVQARPAKEFDLSKLDESMIMDMPFIEAKSFDVPALLQVTPKDPAVRFRWVNYKNEEGGNYQKFVAIGFTNGRLDDIKDTTGLGPNLIKEDGTVKFYDVMLMKVNVFFLMSAYKKNIQQSLHQVGAWDKTAIAEAERTFKSGCRPDMLEAMRRAGLNVEFYTPTMGEMRSQDAEFN